MATYRGYNEVQDQKEAVVDGLLRQIDETGYDRGLSDEWVAFLDRWYAPLRYPAHGLQMLAAYIAQQSKGAFKVDGSAFEVAPYGIAFSKTSTLDKAVLAAMKVLIADGIYKKILVKWGIQAGAITKPAIS